MRRVAACAAVLGLLLIWQTLLGEPVGHWLRAQRAPQLEVPAGWPAPRYDFGTNPVTRDGFELGRKLFYDPRLSRDGSIACANCHQQFAAFAHHAHRVSHGVGGAEGQRNAPALFNLAWQPAFMADGAIAQLELQPVAPLSHPLEMGNSLAQVVATLRTSPDYPGRFAAAFGSDTIDGQRVLLALTQFIGSLQSAHSRYDEQRAGRTSFSADEQRGLEIFRARCANCHAEPLMTDFSYRNNGLDAEPRDPGRAAISRDPADHGRFRVPSLRNVAVTAPYMHDGRFDTLDAVLDHYDHGIQRAANLDPDLKDGIALDSDERHALLLFLDTLTDHDFLHDRRFADAGDP